VRNDRKAGTLRGWDIYVGVFSVMLGLAIPTVNDCPSWSWVPALVCYVVWYVAFGRRALARHEHWCRTLYCAGAMVTMMWMAKTDPWLNPLIGIALPLVWWLYLPDRRRAVCWTVAICAGMTAGLELYVQFGPTHLWSMTKTVLCMVVFPVAIVVAAIVMGYWADTFFRWGHERRELVADLRDTEQHRIVLEREAAVAQERLRMAQEIHDTIAQDAAGVRFLVAQARRQVDLVSAVHPEALDVAGQPRPLPQTMAVLTDAAETMLTQTRTLITTSMPPPPDTSFYQAVERLVTRFSEETGLAVDAEVPDEPLGQESESVFMRCLQEGLSNVRKHAQASHVWVSIGVAGDMAVMTLTDNGVGMGESVGRGFGLPGLAGRVRQAGGSFSVESPGPSLGVTMRVSMPARVPSAT
jgi:signal transduction histidine kinase